MRRVLRGGGTERIHHLLPEGVDEDGWITVQAAASPWLLADPLGFLLKCRAGPESGDAIRMKGDH
eukprot:6010774-Alexandrium_andersonii.AAC.1